MPDFSLYSQFRSGWNANAPFLLALSEESWTYADLDRLTEEFGRRLRRLGLVRGSRAVVLVERSRWNFTLYLACVRCGVVYVPLNPALTPAELAQILIDAEPHLVICDPKLLERVASLTARASSIWLTLDSEGHGTFAAVELDDSTFGEVQPEDPAAIIFTSGTTGRQKGVVIPHAHFVKKAQALATALKYSSSDRLLHCMPLYHAHGLFMTLHCVLSVGASIFYMPRFDAADVADCLKFATTFSGVPTMYKRLLDVPSLAEKSRGVRLFVSGSAPLQPDTFRAFEEEAGHRIVEVWGMSETMTNTSSPISGERKAGSVGRALPGVEIRVVDDSGTVLPTGQPGTLEVRFPTRFTGYWRRPESAQPVFRDGYMATGDIGYLDRQGYLTIIGRKGDMIISGGYNVYPAEVELALEKELGGGKAAVFGVPHPDLGEAVVAAIELAPGVPVDSEELIAQMKRHLVGYKVPKTIFIVPRLHLTELGKTKRAALTMQFKSHFCPGVPTA